MVVPDPSAKEGKKWKVYYSTMDLNSWNLNMDHLEGYFLKSTESRMH